MVEDGNIDDLQYNNGLICIQFVIQIHLTKGAKTHD